MECKVSMRLFDYSFLVSETGWNQGINVSKTSAGELVKRIL